MANTHSPSVYLHSHSHCRSFIFRLTQYVRLQSNDLTQFGSKYNARTYVVLLLLSRSPLPRCCPSPSVIACLRFVLFVPVSVWRARVNASALVCVCMAHSRNIDELAYAPLSVCLCATDTKTSVHEHVDLVLRHFLSLSLWRTRASPLPLSYYVCYEPIVSLRWSLSLSPSSWIVHVCVCECIYMHSPVIGVDAAIRRGRACLCVRRVSAFVYCLCFVYSCFFFVSFVHRLVDFCIFPTFLAFPSYARHTTHAMCGYSVLYL